MIQRLLSVLLALVLLFHAGTAQALFLSPDPMSPDLPGVGTNRYAYSGGDPINRSDPGGNFFKEIGEFLGGVADGFSQTVTGTFVLGDTPMGDAGAQWGAGVDAALGIGPSISGSSGRSVTMSSNNNNGNGPSSTGPSLTQPDGQSIVASGDPGCDPDECDDLFTTTSDQTSASYPENRLSHVFQSRHNMNSLIERFGSREEALAAIERAAQREYAMGRLNVGLNNIINSTRISVEGIEVDVIGGRIVDGVVEVSNASRMLIGP